MACSLYRNGTLTKECFEIEQLCSLSPKQAAEAIGKTLFKKIIPANSDEQKSVRRNIKKSENGVHGSGHGFALIHALARHGCELAIQLLLQKGADIEAECEFGTALTIASYHGKEGTVKLLLERNVNVNAKDKRGKTPLIVATLAGHIDIVELLLDKGADANAKYIGGTALMDATVSERDEIVALLLEKGADTEAENKYGVTPLSAAAKNGYRRIARLLLDNDANIEARDKNGNTPLMFAARNEQLLVLELLLSRGANVEARNRDGASALTLANIEPGARGTSLRGMTSLHQTPTITLLLNARSTARNKIRPQ